MKRYTKGFTLIELLVVIAIIGILASVVLVSLNSARNKGKDARVISSVQQMRTQAESLYDGTNYSAILSASNTTQAHGSGLNSSNTVVSQLMSDVAAQQTGGQIYAITGAGPTAYAIYGRLVSDNTRYFCIDSTGRTNPSTATANGATCP